MEILKKTMLQAVITGTTRGYWNAATNVPDISTNLVTGYMWYVSVSGTTPLSGISVWDVGDWAIKYDDGWGKLIINAYDYTGSTGNTLIIPDLSVIYYAKIGLKQVGHDLGFMDVYK